MKSEQSSNVGRPEPVLFLELAMDAMRDYHRRLARYPSTWFELGMSFSGGPYHVGDPGTLPSEQEGNSWQPPRCRYRYRLERATLDEFRMTAVGPSGTAEYELTEKMSSPRRLVTSAETIPAPQK